MYNVNLREHAQYTSRFFGTAYVLEPCSQQKKYNLNDKLYIFLGCEIGGRYEKKATPESAHFLGAYYTHVLVMNSGGC